MGTVLLNIGGRGLDLLRQIDLAVGVWCVCTIEALRGLDQNTVVLLAVKSGDVHGAAGHRAMRGEFAQQLDHAAQRSCGVN